jgi:hypothetical protein
LIAFVSITPVARSSTTVLSPINKLSTYRLVVKSRIMASKTTTATRIKVGGAPPQKSKSGKRFDELYRLKGVVSLFESGRCQDPPDIL